jgi:hypothetical protein
MSDLGSNLCALYKNADKRIAPAAPGITSSGLIDS